MLSGYNIYIRRDRGGVTEMEERFPKNELWDFESSDYTKREELNFMTREL